MSATSLPPVPAADSAEELFRHFVEFGPDTLVMLRPDGRCRYVSPASSLLLGRMPGDLTGIPLRDLVLEADRHIADDLVAELNAGVSSTSARFRVHCAYGTCVWVEANARRMPAGEGAVLSLRDVTARKEEEALLIEANELLRRRATLDPVTCLPNRGHFVAGLERELRRAHRDGKPLILLTVGIDDMRLFNDFYGRDAGDVAIREVAAAIQAAVSRPGDLVGRLKGPVLGVVLPGTALAGAEPVMRRIREAVAGLALEHAGTPSGQIRVTVSLACAKPGMRSDALIREAACEMEVARAAHGACVVD